MDEKQDETRFPEPEVVVGGLHHRKSLNHHVSLFNLQGHPGDDCLKLCPNCQDYLLKVTDKSDQLGHQQLEGRMSK